jgi:5-methyltetrahydropteroyltriglutamate--homocysteine methyltransferase
MNSISCSAAARSASVASPCESRCTRAPDSDKGLGLGVINIKKLVVETEDEILAGVRKALEYREPERIYLTPDCGQFSIPRPMAKGKLEAMTAAARTLREEIGG